jgi:hypothetical protein
MLQYQIFLTLAIKKGLSNKRILIPVSQSQVNMATAGIFLGLLGGS